MEQIKASTLLTALRRKHAADAVVREVVMDDPFEHAYRRRAEVERIRKYSGDIHAERMRVRYVEQGKAVADELPEGWDYRTSTPQRRIDALVLASTGITAVEIKVSRADFRRETEQKRRAWRAVTNRFVYLTPVGLLLPSEIPTGCGLWEFDPDTVGRGSWQHGIKAAKKATVAKEPNPLPFQITRALAYRVSRAEAASEKANR